jgi:ABC-type sugar transport system ATPase subunit
MANRAPYAIEIEHLTKRYEPNTVLNSLSLDVEEGELLVVLGESGSGKSTLLKTIAGLDSPQSGHVRLYGDEQTHNPPHQRDVAIVFQYGNGYDHLTVRENLALALKVNSKAGIARSAELTRWTQLLDLEPLLSKKLPQLSGGQSQRVAIARAFLSGKRIVLLDEPLAHLDQVHRAEIRDLILQVQSETNRTMVYVTHDSEEAMHLASRIAILSSGRIQQVGSPRDVYFAPQSLESAKLLGNPAMNFLKVPTRWLDQSCAPSECLCGIRPHDWRLDAIIQPAIDPLSQRAQPPIGLRDRGESIEVVAQIHLARWLGDRWFVAAKLLSANGFDRQPLEPSSSQITFTAPSPLAEPMESRIRLIAQINPRATIDSHWIQASISKSSIRRF